jgi:hypothetical protein
MMESQKCPIAEKLEQEIAEASVAKILDGAKPFGIKGPDKAARDSAFEHHERLETKKTNLRLHERICPTCLGVQQTVQPAKKKSAHALRRRKRSR